MSLRDRLRGIRHSFGPSREPASLIGSARLHPGDDDLEVVGESSNQAALWAICNGSVGDRVRHRIVAVLVPEPTNTYDANAISVQVDGSVVGYLPRDIAARYLPALHRMMDLAGGHVALDGVIVGGGYYEDGPGRLGVWLSHDAEAFGGPARRAGQLSDVREPLMRTGFSEAWRTDAEDDSYDLSWYSGLPAGDRQAIAALRDLLGTERDPIDRHFQFAELQARLYRCRELYDTALDEFDDACRQHDAEMETICQSFMAKWNKVPLLETYRQMAIRQQKNKDWDACLWWAERGLELYGNDAAREDAVEDLLKRRNRALSRIEARQGPTSPAPADQAGSAGSSTRQGERSLASSQTAVERLICSSCAGSFERARTRGRKPLMCPACR